MELITREQLIDKERLVAWLSADVDAIFEENRANCKFPDDPTKRHLFFPAKSRILAVCHLDTVQDPFHPDDVKITDRKIVAAGLDDRLGAYVLTKLKEWGMPCDLLMCDNEESGRSTAEFFETKKKYNWVVEFDRKGQDVVHYKVDNDKFETYVKDIGGRYMTGSFTDICKLTSLPGDPFKFNVGVGYVNAHSKDSYAIIDELHYNMVRFQMIWEKFSGTKLDAQAKTYPAYNRSKHQNTAYNGPRRRYKYVGGVSIEIHPDTGKELTDGDCRTCWGEGLSQWGWSCWNCDGTGREDKKSKSLAVSLRKPGDPCTACEGTGRSSTDSKCWPCKGTGKWKPEDKPAQAGQKVPPTPTVITYELRPDDKGKQWYRVETKGHLCKIFAVDNPEEDKKRLIERGEAVERKKEVDLGGVAEELDQIKKREEKDDFIEESSISKQRFDALVPWTTRGLLDGDPQDETSCPECRTVHQVADVLVADACPKCDNDAFSDEGDEIGGTCESFNCYECGHLDFSDHPPYVLSCTKRIGLVLDNEYAMDNKCVFFEEMEELKTKK